ncbi:dihydrolipoyl dehydrogenase [Occallatibacter riparius]|uniref:Dihydrolipoyl dehydrogenase n=1 Tax=Occallatibacter riparius TaxID=1002689 RepID=A0A9J7BW17_9BACT|nr:dihydrolipoyl dehydrogenase [Occallatibacter riparius]UWZ85994.1 dihydrolipoyl dehydrogenase [Occallatibacter riparius]
MAEDTGIIYDVAIIGSGPAGYTAAIRGGQYGLKVALIEADPSLGGTCLHVGCIPTKALLFNAEIWDYLKEAAEYGITGIGTPQLDWAAVQTRKSSIVTKHTKGLDFLMKKNKVTVVRGYGRLTGPAVDGVHTVDLEASDGAKQQLKAKNILLATGSEARMLFGLKPDDRILTNIEMLSVAQPPKSLIVIGAGAVGVEFSSIFRSFGTEVTIVEFLPRLVPVEDEDISKELTRQFKKRNIDVNTASTVQSIEKTDAGVKVTWTTANGQTRDKEAEKVLVAVGRAPRTANVGIEKTKIELDRGFVKVDETQQTAEPGIYAIGDIVAGLPQLAHVGAMSGIVAMAKIAGRKFRPVRRDRIPGCTYTDPQIGSAGLTEAQAKEKGYEVKIGKFPFAGNSKATIVDSHDGFVKIVADAKYGELLGVHIIGPQATELIAEAIAVMELEGTVDELMFTIHAHPTLSEAMLDAYAAVEGMAINA